jgi:hypothetical protein
MTCYTFARMPPSFQLTWLLEKGTYLARRWEEEGAIALYYLPDGGRGFFAEVSHDACQRGSFVVRSFSNSLPLEEYAHGVQLPEA